MESYFVKVSSPEFQLPQVVLDNLPDWATQAEVRAEVEAYAASQPGVTAADFSFTFVQATPQTIWTIVHPLPFAPNVTITDSAGTAVMTEITYPAPNMVRSTAAGAFSGVARLS